MFQVLGYLSGIFSALGYLPYIRSTLRLKTKPERASWLIWTVIGVISFSSQLAKGASHSLWLPGIQLLGDLCVLILAIRLGVGGFKRRDYIALFAAGVGLVMWYFTKEAALALLIILMIDIVGGYLTLVKTYQNPSTEPVIAWIISGLSGLFAFLAVGEINIILLIYPFYVFLIGFSVVLAIYLGRRKQLRQ